MTSEERLGALESLGYAKREAAFLTLAALHSGYFVPRQYRRFLGQTAGRPEAELVRKVVENRHAKREPTAQKTQVCHLCSHPFYRAIGEADNRHRRDRAPLAVKAKLMGLDFVLDHPGASFLATEQEKIGYFHGSCGIDLAILPSRIYRSDASGESTDRYFIEKYPILLRAAGGRRDAVVSFSYVDEGVLSTSGFESFLSRYGPLFMRLRRLRLVYVADKGKNLLAAARKLDRFLEKLRSGEGSGASANHNNLTDYFELRRRFEAREFADLDKRKLDRLSRYKRTFTSPDIERKFEDWRSLRPQGKGAVEATDNKVQPLRVEFSTARLRHNYDIFGPTVQVTRRPPRTKNA